jgi:hypothetical protein
MTTGRIAQRVARPAEHRNAAVVQRAMTKPADRAEGEAERIGRQVARMPAPATLVSPQARRFAGVVPGGVTTGGGQPLPQPVRRFMEPRLQADFSAVRMHTGPSAARASRQLNAAAFTVGHEVFFGEGRFQPDTEAGRELIAHELAHTLQQGAALQAEGLAPAPQRLGLGDALQFFAERAEGIPGFRLLCLVLGRNPVSGAPVARSAPELLRALFELVPGAALLLQALNGYGVVGRAADWVQQRFAALAAIGTAARRGLDAFLASVSWSDALDPAGLWERARRVVTEPVARVIDFGRGLAGELVALVREAVLQPLAALARRLPGYALLSAVLGFDPITREPVARTPDAVIGGLMRLCGQEEVWLNLQRANAVPRAMAWYASTSGGLVALVGGTAQRFADTLAGLDLSDLVSLPRTFARLAGVFTGAAGEGLRWGGEAVWALLEIVVDAVAPEALPALRRAGPALRSVLRDPAGFVRGFILAAVTGLQQFVARVASTVRSLLVGWLSTVFAGTGVQVPRSLAPRELIAFALSALGLTWAALRGRLVRIYGEPAVRAIELGAGLARELVTQGPAAAWALLLARLPALHEMVIAQLVRLVAVDIVQAGVRVLLAGLREAGDGFIGALLAIRNTLQFFTQQLRDLVAVGAAAVASIATLAAGQVAVAAGRIAQALERSLQRAIAFIAGLLGLGNLASAVLAVVRRVRVLVETALDAVLRGLVDTTRRAGSFFERVARMFRTRTGEMVELPDDLTAEAATRLEAEGTAASAKLGQRPPPRPVSPVDGRAHVLQPRAGTVPARGRRGAAHTGARAVPGAAAAAGALMKAVGHSALARYLVAQGTPALVRGVGRLGTLRANEQTHDDAAAKRAQSEQAVVIPRSDEQSKGNAAQVGTVEAKPPPKVDIAKPRARLRESLAENVPRTLEDVDNFKRDMKAQHIGADVLQVVHGDKDAVMGTFGEVRTTPAPVPTDHVTKELPPMEAAPATAAMNLGAGTVAPLRRQDLDVGQYTRDADRRLTEEGVSQEQLDMVDSGELADARREKLGLEKNAVAQPAAAQAFAKEQANAVSTELRLQETKERSALHAHRRQGLGTTAKRQLSAKQALEKKREDVARQINEKYEATQRNVKRRLGELETAAMQRFDRGNAEATQRFENGVKAELDAYKADRYSGFFGKLRKAKDWLLGMDDLPRVKEIFETNRSRFVETIHTLVETITADNQRVIRECKDEIAATNASIKAFVAGLEPALQDVGRNAASEIGDKLKALDGFVAAREGELRRQLQDKQRDAIKAIDDKIEKMKEAMSGALAKLGRLLLWAAKQFFTWALGKFGYSLSDIEAIISKGAAVLKAIFTQPIQFVKNLVRAAKQGFESFALHFLEHLKDAIFEWLTGSLSGIRLPEVWNARGIFGLVLQVLNISAGRIRDKLVDKLGGAAILQRLEEGVAVVKTVLTEGPAAAWEQVKDLGEQLKEQAIAQLQQFIAIEIVKRATQTIALMFVPGAGIIRAIVGIYDTVVFFIKKAADIARMVGNFLGSIGEIAAGNIGAAAQALEDGLARALKLVIDFLARFLKLDGIPKKIGAVLEKIRAKVDALLDRVVDWIVGLAKGLGRGIKTVAANAVQWWRARTPFGQGRNRHTLHFAGEGPQAVLSVSSTTKTIRDFIADDIAPKVKNHPKAGNLKLIMAQVEIVEEIKSRTRGGFGKTDGEAIGKAMAEIATLLADLGSTVPASHLPEGKQKTRQLPDGSVVGERMTAEPLTRNPGSLRGSEPYDETATWLAVRRRRHAYVRGHLLNHHLFGAGKNENLVPITGRLNTWMSSNIEEAVKNAVLGEGRTMRYEVTFTFGGHSGVRKIPEENTLPTAVRITAREVVEKDSKYVDLPGGFAPPVAAQDHVLPLDGPLDGAKPILQRLALNAPQAEETNAPKDLDALQELPGIGPERAQKLLDKRKDGPFTRWAQVEETVQRKDITDAWLELKTKDGRVVYLDGKTTWRY